MEIFNEIVNFTASNGFVGILILIICAVIIISVRFAFAYMPYLVKNMAIKAEEKKIWARQKADKLIREQLSRLLLNSKGDRAMIVEFHNGKENMTGLPFRYGTFTYEIERSDDMEKVGHKYDELNLSRYTAPTYLLENKYYIGTVEDFKPIDKTMARYMEDDGGKYVCLLLLKQRNTNIGILILTYNEEYKIDEKRIMGVLTQYVQEISSLLTLDKEMLNGKKLNGNKKL